MRIKMKSFLQSKMLYSNMIWGLTLLMGSSLYAQNPLHIVLGSNNEPITEVKFNYDGNDIIQTQGQSGNTATNLPVNLEYFEINGTTKLYINDFGNVVRNNNFSSQTSGVGIYKEGSFIETDAMGNFEAVLDEAINDRNLMQFLYYDGQSNVPTGSDFDIFFAKGLTSGDYVAVGERNGNTDFSITPLDELGNPITNSTTLLFGETDGVNSGNGTTKYDWDIGYAPTNYATQSMIYSVVDASLFNVGSETIFGFRIDNNGNADVKFFGLSDDGFADSPTNPKIGGLTGNIFNDSDGLVNSTVDGNPISQPDGVQLYANLYDSNTGTVIASVPINADGSFEFLDLPAGSNYAVSVSTNQGTAGAALPPQNLPSDWVYTGEFTDVSPGNDGSNDGIQTSLTVVEDLVTNVNFGIEELPTADPYSFAIDSPVPNSTLVIGSGITSDLSGNDPEDGAVGTGGSFGISSLPSNGNDLIYNGMTITVGADGVNPPSPSNPFIINNYDPSLLEINFNGDPNQSDTSFDYVTIDDAGLASAPVTYTLLYSALPVEWQYFRVVKSADQADLQFATSLEINNSHFIIQKSIDGNRYYDIGQVEGSIDSREVNEYSFIDNDLEVGMNYYRIKQVDLNGASSHSVVRAIDHHEVEPISVFPNPVGLNNPVLNIKNIQEEDSRIRIYNTLGSLIKEIKIQDNLRTDNLSIDLSNLDAGAYILQVGQNRKSILFNIVQ